MFRLIKQVVLLIARRTSHQCMVRAGFEKEVFSLFKVAISFNKEIYFDNI
jgi:hypothetical protein